MFFQSLTKFLLFFSFQTAQGIRNLPPDVAIKLAGEDPDYSIRDLYDSIENGNYPVWRLMIQVALFQLLMNDIKSALVENGNKRESI